MKLLHVFSSPSLKGLLVERATSASTVFPRGHTGGCGGAGVFLSAPPTKNSPLPNLTVAARAGVLETRPNDVPKPWKTADARLVLEDGSIWRAKSFGASGTQVGEVVFNTSLTGYQEILTDPSYAGQFVLMTNPHIGNTGVNPDDEESNQCFLAGLVIRSLSICTSNWRCTEPLGDYLAKRNIMGIYDVDTRAITRRLREDGSLIGVLSTEESKTDEELRELSRNWKIVAGTSWRFIKLWPITVARRPGEDHPGALRTGEALPKGAESRRVSGAESRRESPRCVVHWGDSP